MALDLMFEVLGDAKGLAWIPEWPATARKWLDCTPVRTGAVYYWDPGIQGTAKV